MLSKIISWVVIVVVVLLAVALFGFIAYVWLVYGGKPITEIPAWALWLIWNK